MSMYEYLTNPALIYSGPSGRAAALLTKQRAPLILVHDGGGTNFSYHLLNPVDRPLWGIENARLHDGGFWEGGIAQMAAHYVGLLAKILPEGGDILLGGWSLGGHLSLEMAHQIALAGQKDRRGGNNGSSSATSTPAPKFRVIGMIFIDTVFPLRLGELRGPLATEPVYLTPEQSKAMVLKDKVDLNMTHARMMVAEWDVPRWEGLTVPPTILMRAKEFVSNDPSKTFVDYVREFKLLGWDEYNAEHGNFIQDVVEVEGHHFSIFEMKNLDNISNKVRNAADELDPPEF
ncbi:alpha/beta-hydrolase [Annulohypoxylon moriforme]|nr:alpha/beta-hydrolase [Annulohypoxylon moriforme]